MSARRNVVACLSSLLALVALAGCGAGSDAGDGEKKGAKEPAPPTSSPLVCPDGAQCFDFADKDSGWPEQNETGYFANQDPYLDGSYRIGGREAGTWNVTSPVQVTELANDYGVQIETDAVSGEGFPANAAWGASCWTALVDGGGFSGFGVYVQQGTATLGLWNQYTGEFKPLKNRDVSGLVKAGQKNHLTLSCRQESASGGAQARIDVELNGSAAVSIAYANSVQNFGWKPADGVGLLVAGKGADVFYDDVVITGKCDQYCA